jgi:hypothetical protein
VTQAYKDHREFKAIQAHKDLLEPKVILVTQDLQVFKA